MPSVPALRRQTGLECGAIGAGAYDAGRKRRPLAQGSHRGQQYIHALEVAQLADEQEVGGIGVRLYRCDFVCTHSIVGNGESTARLSYFGAECVVLKSAHEQKKVCIRKKQLFHGEEGCAGHRQPAVMQAAAMGCVDRPRPIPAHLARGQPRIGAALGAVSMQDLGFCFAGDLSDGSHGPDVRQGRQSPHWHAMHAKATDFLQSCEMVFEFG
jgi:hypothetical protein